MAGYGGNGWGGVDAASEREKQEFGGGGGDHLDFFLKTGDTKRVLFINEEPWAAFFHGTYLLKGPRDRPLCLHMNGIDEGNCPWCNVDKETRKAKGLWPRLSGAFTVIDMGYVHASKDGQSVTLKPYVTDDGKSFQFQRKIYSANKGSDDKPGMLTKLRQKMSRKGGSLKGVVLDCTRSGDKTESIGDDIEFVERVPEKDWPAYLRQWGASDETLSKLSLDPFDFDTIYKPWTVEQMRKRLEASGVYSGGPPSGGSSSGNGKAADGAGFDDASDEIPF